MPTRWATIANGQEDFARMRIARRRQPKLPEIERI
jgi:hypothetical protein